MVLCEATRTDVPRQQEEEKDWGGSHRSHRNEVYRLFVQRRQSAPCISECDANSKMSICDGLR